MVQCHPLPYPLSDLACSDGTVQKEYIIPDNAREAILEQLYFMEHVPSLEDTRFDLHEQKLFKVKDYRVIRWHGTNILASPYFPHTGGMVMDWMEPENLEDTCHRLRDGFQMV